MKRSVLLSLLTIGLAITIAGTGSTLSVFTDSSTGSTPGGDGINAADLDLLVHGEDDTLVAASEADDGDGQGTAFVFTLGGAGCDLDNLFPSAVCSRLVTIGNDGSLSFTYTVDVWADDNGVDDGALGFADDTVAGCFDVDLDFAAGGVPAYATVDATDDSDISGAPAGGSYPASVGDANDLAPTELMQIRVSAVVDDDDACQGAGGYIVVTVQAAQSATPTD